MVYCSQLFFPCSKGYLPKLTGTICYPFPLKPHNVIGARLWYTFYKGGGAFLIIVIGPPLGGGGFSWEPEYSAGISPFRIFGFSMILGCRVSPKCPIDGKGIKKESTFPDSAISREIGGLKCRCNNSIIGCQWIGEVRTVAVSWSIIFP